MAGTQTVTVVGLRELLRVTDELPKETRKAVRKEIREAAYPIRDRAQRDLVSYLSDHRHGSEIAKKTRYGVSVRRSGTVVVEQRVRSKYAPGNAKRRRPKFTDLQLDESLLPAAAAEAPELDRAMTNVLERLQRKWVTG